MQHSTRFAGLSRVQAGAVLVVTLVTTLWFIRVALTQEVLPVGRAAHLSATQETLNSDSATVKPQILSDVDFYARIVERVRGGRGYYDALIEEISQPEWNARAPTSVFNWRLPTYAWLFAALPAPEWGQALLIGLSLMTWMMAFTVVSSEIGPAWSSLCLLLLGPLAWCLPAKIYLFTELWAGVLITLSILCYSFATASGEGFRFLAVAAGIVALLFRELALPYCLLGLVLAARERQWAEVAAWCLGLAVFGVFFNYHYHEVSQRVSMSDGVQASTWVRFGGTAFLIGTTQMSNIVLIVLPAWFSAIYLTSALLGLAGWSTSTGWRAFLTCVGYLAIFAVAGQPNNAYWGLMIAPLLALGIVALPAALRDLPGCARPSSGLV